MSLGHVKLCDVEDFADAGLLAAAADILSERDPAQRAERKAWEFAMLALFLESEGLLNDATEALGVGAGNERILYWLATGSVGWWPPTSTGRADSRRRRPSTAADRRDHRQPLHARHPGSKGLA